MDFDTFSGEFQVFAPSSANRSPILKNAGRYFQEDIEEETGVLLATSNSHSTQLTSGNYDFSVKS